MARYIPRKCPKCHDEFWITISHPSPQSRELPVIAFCVVCGYRLNGWRLILNGKRAPDVRYAPMRKVFR